MANGEPLEIAGSELVHILRTPPELFASGGCVLLDCRPFLSYSRAHIRGSRNVNWNSMLRRRSKSAVVSLEWLVPDRSLLSGLRAGHFSPVVVLDEESRSVAELKAESLASMLLSALRAEVEPGAAQICFLQGGFESFFGAYGDLCVNSAAASGNQSSARDPEPGLSGRTTPLYDQDGPVEILPFLFLGSAHHSSRRETLAQCGITAVLNVSSSCPNLFETELLYMTLRVEDSLAADIRARFPEAIRFIDSVKESGGRVLVHCQAGISRSATICLAYLIHSLRVRLDEAFDFVKQRRRVISPNLAFMGQLLQFETDVLCH
ncbi:dual specificity protein phosphatase 2-like [Scleropages formosus]|uniref:Dual specificity protein phosphatase n=1 Tax=Scleropages formosus TaxID=113540 RepID=A0A0P7V5F9_SCLFO|nr:dual specificity protein phosphatase 2 [Scleropages formosus]KPP68363.1 dual specificity protein phosphatase 2-like [Scleropages formosus]